MWEKIADIINEGRRFIITSHLFLEGDAIGSEIALKHFLVGMGKEAIIINNEELPIVYRCFDPKSEIKFYKKDCHNTNIKDFDAIFIVDVGNWDQLGDFAEKIQSSSIVTVCIDHHPTNPGYADVNVIDKEASSAGELIFELISYMQGDITQEIADVLYLSIASDTGWFKFSNTSTKAFDICSALVRKGVKPEIIYEKVCQNKSWSYLKFITLALEKLRSECNGNLAWTKMTREMIESSGIEYVETDVLIDLIRAVGKVEVVILFRELGKKKTKVGFRSKHIVNVSKLAAQFGGGGHVRAAGASLNEPIDSVVNKVLSEARLLVKNSPM
ncbi:MAG: bifunctional oligoribonuclease/PAP phosphatase NrnA [Candidatus Scalinduaceae bacterium]